MFYSRSKFNSPCKDCANRCVGCHSSCPKFRTYEYEKKFEEVERVKSQEGKGGVVARLHAIVR